MTCLLGAVMSLCILSLSPVSDVPSISLPPSHSQHRFPPSVTSYFDFSPPTLWIINRHVGRPLLPLKKIHTRVLTLKRIHPTRKNTNTWHICKIETAGCAGLLPPLRAGHHLLSAGGNLGFLRLGWKTLPSSRAFPLSLTSPLRPASQSRVRLDPFPLPACPHVTYWQINTMSTTCNFSRYMIRDV